MPNDTRPQESPGHVDPALRAGGIALLDRWLAGSQHSRIDTLVKFGPTTRHYCAVLNETPTTGSEVAPAERINTKLPVIRSRRDCASTDPDARPCPRRRNDPRPQHKTTYGRQQCNYHSPNHLHTKRIP